jgi:hypothetical protein
MNFFKKLIKERKKDKTQSKREELKRLFIEGMVNDQDLTKEYIEGLSLLLNRCKEKK